MADPRTCDWIRLQKHIKTTQLLCAHGQLHIEQDDSERLLAALKTQVKDYFFNRLLSQPRWQPRLRSARQPALSENSKYVFCPGSHDAHRFLNEFIFMLRNEPQIFLTVLKLWPRDSVNLPIVIETFADLFFEEVVSPENYEYELLQAIGRVVNLGEHLRERKLLQGTSLLAGFLKCYMRRNAVSQFLKAVYEAPLLEIIYNVPTELIFAVDKIACSLKSYREEFLKPMETYRRRISEPFLFPRGHTSSSGIASNPFTSIPPDALDPETDKSIEVILKDLSERLENICLLVLNSLFDKVGEMPYSLRWICRIVYGSCVSAEWSEEQAGSFLGTLLFPGWEFLLDLLDLNYTLSSISLANLSLSESVLKHIFSRETSISLDLSHMKDFVATQQQRYTACVQRIINIPSFQALAFRTEETEELEVSQQSKLSILHLLDYQQTCAPELTSFLQNFHFQASVFPLPAIPELLNLVLAHKPHFALGVAEQFYLIAEDIAKCFLGPGNSFIETQVLKIQDFETEFDCEPFLIFFLDNSETILNAKNEKMRKNSEKTEDLVKKVTRALIRLFSAIEQIPTLLANSPLLPLISHIQLQSYLFQSKKTSIQQSISARTVANFLLEYLPSLENGYKNDDFERIYGQIVSKTSKMRVKSGTNRRLNEVILLGMRTIEGLLKSENGSFGRQKGVLRELKQWVMGLNVPTCLRVFKLQDGDVCLTASREQFGQNKEKNADFAGNLTYFCSKVEDFIQVFTGLPQVQNSTSSISDIGNVRSCFSSYMEILKDEIRSNTGSFQVSEEVLDELMVSLEDHVTRKMHGDVFPSWASREDIRLHNIAKTASFPPIPHTDFIENAQKLLEKLPVKMTPREKMMILTELVAVIISSDLAVSYDFYGNLDLDEGVKSLFLGLLGCLKGCEKTPRLVTSLNISINSGHMGIGAIDKSWLFPW